MKSRYYYLGEMAYSTGAIGVDFVQSVDFDFPADFVECERMEPFSDGGCPTFWVIDGDTVRRKTEAEAAEEEAAGWHPGKSLEPQPID
jgi:hypothetical protein